MARISVNQNYFRYWGKASPASEQGERFHLLSFHALDVAATGNALIALNQFSLESLATELGWPTNQVEELFVFFLALHDLGKFSRAFQGLVPGLSENLVEIDPTKRYEKRHDTLGWVLWDQVFAEESPFELLPSPEHEFWAVWIRSVVGHHGKPPEEVASGGLIPLEVRDYYLAEDRQAARDFAQSVADWLLPKNLPAPNAKAVKVLRNHVWRIAGLAVLADWLGSNQAFFPYQSTPVPLPAYWAQIQANASSAVDSAGLRAQKLRFWDHPLKLFDYLANPTPLQHYAATVDLESGPQLFLLEDVTGAGKTEAAVVLAQRLMQAGQAHGLYFALPSMATANQMYQRIGNVYRRLYQEEAHPSLILSHGARQLVEGFTQSILQQTEPVDDLRYQPGEASATVQCNGWLADNRKKALLAEVGVGTLDQALLGVLPARHQSLRLLGLAGKVLLVDEVHAYDSYMMSLLKKLLTAHARQGGSVILLSATLPLGLRQDLLDAYRFGRGCDDDNILDDTRYPLAVQAGQTVQSFACETRPQVKRRLQVKLVHDEEHVVDFIVAQSLAGQSVCWIRNTVNDARRANDLVAQKLNAGEVTLFHSRFAMGHRLDIETAVLARFGKHSTGDVRKGQVLIGTQVLEQSLDFDVDVMISDLAPIDLLIQRAGRLHRHARTVDGSPAPDGIERRALPEFHVLTPEPVDQPMADWYSTLFPKATFVYPDSGKLWLAARSLSDAGCIITPGAPGESGSIRELVEAVYGAEEDKVPENLRKATREQIGKVMAMQSQAQFNALKLEKGYCIDSSARWYEDNVVPTRLGDETVTLYLAVWREDRLCPLCDEGKYPWEQSAVRVGAYVVADLAPGWKSQFDAALQQLRGRYRLLEEPAVILPLVESGSGFEGRVMDQKGRERLLTYDMQAGLLW